MTKQPPPTVQNFVADFCFWGNLEMEVSLMKNSLMPLKGYHTHILSNVLKNLPWIFLQFVHFWPHTPTSQPWWPLDLLKNYTWLVCAWIWSEGMDFVWLILIDILFIFLFQLGKVWSDSGIRVSKRPWRGWK